MPPSLLQTSQPTSQTIVTSDFTVRANGLEEQLPDNDRIGQTLADVQQAAGFEEDVARDLAAHLLAILEPYADDIDISRKGEIDGTRVDGDLRAFIEQASEDPTVPRRVIEAAQLALDEGFTDASLLAALHLGLDLVGATEIPVISQIADGVNAGLYVAIDRDYLNAGISLIGVAATGTVALRNSARIGELADDAFDRARIITSLNPERRRNQLRRQPSCLRAMPRGARRAGETPDRRGCDERRFCGP